MAVVYDCQIIGAGAAGISLMIALENQIASASGVDKEKLLSLQNSCVILEGQAQGGGQFALMPIPMRLKWSVVLPIIPHLAAYVTHISRALIPNSR